MIPMEPQHLTLESLTVSNNEGKECSLFTLNCMDIFSVRRQYECTYVVKIAIGYKKYD